MEKFLRKGFCEFRPTAKQGRLCSECRLKKLTAMWQIGWVRNVLMDQADKEKNTVSEAYRKLLALRGSCPTIEFDLEVSRADKPQPMK
ncbi:hypothetical protein [Cerasicoccus frondis]|uniref:hypothetical protein n=1 Tax=Cerasicoccus frondis TaxID=490090 RepID=UPI00285262FA|nr:hypothetical protein [Cerasicoccus frondis]